MALVSDSASSEKGTRHVQALERDLNAEPDGRLPEAGSAPRQLEVRIPTHR
jgi:hypothetical protein